MATGCGFESHPQLSGGKADKCGRGGGCPPKKGTGELSRHRRLVPHRQHPDFDHVPGVLDDMSDPPHEISLPNLDLLAWSKQPQTSGFSKKRCHCARWDLNPGRTRLCADAPDDALRTG